MAVEITIYDVPEDVRDRLAEKAADRSQSLEEYLRQELKRLATTPPVES
ncbi:FitA-like ribbon-helix-helix domain-containing protein [Candidatus Poriferisodalis sp.]